MCHADYLEYIVALCELNVNLNGMQDTVLCRRLDLLVPQLPLYDDGEKDPVTFCFIYLTTYIRTEELYGWRDEEWDAVDVILAADSGDIQASY
jgi:hypothetical protein